MRGASERRHAQGGSVAVAQGRGGGGGEGRWRRAVAVVRVSGRGAEGMRNRAQRKPRSGRNAPVAERSEPRAARVRDSARTRGVAAEHGVPTRLSGAVLWAARRVADGAGPLRDDGCAGKWRLFRWIAVAPVGGGGAGRWHARGE